jgi:hypothetical protein
MNKVSYNKLFLKGKYTGKAITSNKVCDKIGEK